VANSSENSGANLAVQRLREFCDLHKIETLFVAGDWPREMMLGDDRGVTKIEVAVAFSDEAILLGRLFASEFLGVVAETDDTAEKVQIVWPQNGASINIEFQGHPPYSHIDDHEIKDHLRNEHIDMTPLMRNVLSRSFTVDAVVFDLKDGQFRDPTGKAFNDIDDKRIRSIIPPGLLVKHRPTVVFDALDLKYKHDLKISSDLTHRLEGLGPLLLAHMNQKDILDRIVGVLKAGGVDALKQLKRFRLERFLANAEIKRRLKL